MLLDGRSKQRETRLISLIDIIFLLLVFFLVALTISGFVKELKRVERKEAEQEKEKPYQLPEIAAQEIFKPDQEYHGIRILVRNSQPETSSASGLEYFLLGYDGHRDNVKDDRQARQWRDSLYVDQVDYDEIINKYPGFRRSLRANDDNFIKRHGQVFVNPGSELAKQELLNFFLMLRLMEERFNKKANDLPIEIVADRRTNYAFINEIIKLYGAQSSYMLKVNFVVTARKA